MSMRALCQFYTPKQMLTCVALAATKTTVALDLANVIANQIVIEAGAYTDGLFAWTVQDSADNTTYATASAADLVFVPATQTSITNTNTAAGFQRFSYIGSKRYIRLVATATTATAGVLCTVQALVKYHKNPTT